METAQFTGTDGPIGDDTTLDLDSINKLNVAANKAFLASFEGIPVFTSPILKGNQHYLIVSQKLYDKLQGEKS